MAVNAHLPTPAMALSLLLGIALGGGATDALRAQSRPVVYSVDQAFTEVDLEHVDEYIHDYLPIIQIGIKAYGGTILAETSTITTMAGRAPRRAVITLWPSVEKFKAWYNSPEYRYALQISEKYTQDQVFAVKASSQ